MSAGGARSGCAARGRSRAPPTPHSRALDVGQRRGRNAAGARVFGRRFGPHTNASLAGRRDRAAPRARRPLHPPVQAAGIASTLAALNATYGRGEPISPRRLRKLLTAAAPALLADAAVWVSRVADAFLCAVESAAGGGASSAASPGGSPPPPSAAFVAGLADDAVATAALKARLQTLARGRGTLPHAPPQALAGV